MSVLNNAIADSLSKLLANADIRTIESKPWVLDEQQTPPDKLDDDSTA